MGNSSSTGAPPGNVITWTKEQENQQQWFLARNTFLQLEQQTQNFSKALSLASQCKDIDDASWLCSIFPSPPSNRADARRALFNLPDDPRAACFGALVDPTAIEWDKIQQSAEKGVALAEAFLARLSSLGYEEQVKTAEKAAAKNEPQAYVILGELFAAGPTGDMSKPETEKKTEAYKAGAQLASPTCMYSYGCLLEEDNPERYFWRSKAASAGYNYSAISLGESASYLQGKFERGELPKEAWRAYGHALQPFYDAQKGTVMDYKIPEKDNKAVAKAVKERNKK